MRHCEFGFTIQVEGGYHLTGRTPDGHPASLNNLGGRWILKEKRVSDTELLFTVEMGNNLDLLDDSKEYERIVIDPDAIVI